MVGRRRVTDLAVVLAKNDIQHPVAAVFHTPVMAHERRQTFGIRGGMVQR